MVLWYCALKWKWSHHTFWYGFQNCAHVLHGYYDVVHTWTVFFTLCNACAVCVFLFGGFSALVYLKGLDVNLYVATPFQWQWLCFFVTAHGPYIQIIEEPKQVSSEFLETVEWCRRFCSNKCIRLNRSSSLFSLWNYDIYIIGLIHTPKVISLR